MAPVGFEPTTSERGAQHSTIKLRDRCLKHDTVFIPSSQYKKTAAPQRFFLCPLSTLRGPEDPSGPQTTAHCSLSTIHCPLLLCYSPLRAASIAATSIFFMGIIASNARFASSPPAVIASTSTRGVICHDTPQRSLHHPH